jgi:hypothetical protein
MVGSDDAAVNDLDKGHLGGLVKDMADLAAGALVEAIFVYQVQLHGGLLKLGLCSFCLGCVLLLGTCAAPASESGRAGSAGLGLAASADLTDAQLL